MSLATIQPSPSYPTNIQHRLTQIELQLQRQSAFAGSSASAFSAASGMSSPWIFNSGASYHMISDSTILFAITPLPSHFLPLNTVDGSHLVITQTWSIISPTITLPSVLHIHIYEWTSYPSVACAKLVSSLLSITSLVLCRIISQLGQLFMLIWGGDCTTLIFFMSLSVIFRVIVLLLSFCLLPICSTNA